MVSIIMPAYNAEKTITSSIQSILNQSYLDWELLICDDCSIDSTYKIISDFSGIDSRIRVFKNKFNSGVAQTRNLLINQSIGDYIAFLDSDDLWLPDKLFLQMNFMLKNELPFTITPYLINSGGKFTALFPREKITYNELLKYNDIPLLTVIISKNILFPFNKIRHEDYDLWLRILKGGNVCVCIKEGFLSIYNVQDNSITSNKLKSSIWHFKVLFQNIKNPIKLIFLSYFYTIYQIKKKLRSPINTIYD